MFTVTISAARIIIVRANITTIAADAIVNAANTKLQKGGGIDGAIHAAAGPELQVYLDEYFPKGCPTGGAVITPSFMLAPRIQYIIHTPGPKCAKGQKSGEVPEVLQRQLNDCYVHCMDLANQNYIRTLAFPSISTGIFHYPLKDAAFIAIGAVSGWTQTNPDTVIFVLYDEATLRVYQEVLTELGYHEHEGEWVK